MALAHADDQLRRRCLRWAHPIIGREQYSPHRLSSPQEFAAQTSKTDRRLRARCPAICRPSPVQRILGRSSPRMSIRIASSQSNQRSCATQSRRLRVNIRRTLGVDLARFGVSSRALFCTNLPSAFFARVRKPVCIGLFLVLPVRIVLTTSPLPRGCSTTELRQRRAGGGNRETCVGRKSGAILATRAKEAQAHPVRAVSRPLLAGPAVVVLAA